MRQVLNNSTGRQRINIAGLSNRNTQGFRTDNNGWDYPWYWAVSKDSCRKREMRRQGAAFAPLKLLFTDDVWTSNKSSENFLWNICIYRASYPPRLNRPISSIFKAPSSIGSSMSLLKVGLDFHYLFFFQNPLLSQTSFQTLQDIFSNTLFDRAAVRDIAFTHPVAF